MTSKYQQITENKSTNPTNLILRNFLNCEDWPVRLSYFALGSERRFPKSGLFYLKLWVIMMMQ